MAKRLPKRTIEIEGYGPATIRALSPGEWALIEHEAGGDVDLQLTEIVRKGCVRPDIFRMSGAAVIAEFEDRPDALAAIGEAIIDLSARGI